MHNNTQSQCIVCSILGKRVCRMENKKNVVVVFFLSDILTGINWRSNVTKNVSNLIPRITS